MNIKTLTPSPVLPVEPKQRVEGGTRLKGSSDRDANGKREQKEEEVKRHLSQQEFDDSIRAL